MPRYEIEGRGPEQIAEELINVFDEHCSAQGPSISPEQFSQVIYAKQCGSKIPIFKG